MSDAPSRIGRYELIEQLGEGAMGVVWKARDPAIGRQLAVKLLKPSPQLSEQARQELRQRFSREAQAAGRLSHPGVVVIHDVGVDEQSGEPFIAMELIEGESLTDLIRRAAPLAPGRVGELGGQLADALGYAHQAGIVHRDLKPANVLLDAQGRVRVMDFGIARVEQSQLTREGTFLGSPSHAAPEQLKGEPVDARADVWALGVLLYTLLTGQHPFPSSKLSELIKAVLHDEPPPPSQVQPGVPRAWDQLVAALLSKSRDGRPASMAKVLERLDAIEDADIHTQPTPNAGSTLLADSGQQASAVRALASAALVVVEGTGAGTSFPLHEELITIGRKHGNLLLADPEVSGRHCQLERAGANWRLEDLGSTNGCFIDDERVESGELRPGSTLRVGQTLLRLESLTPAEAAAAPPSSDASGTLVDGGDPTLRVRPSRFQLVGRSGAAEGVRFVLPIGRTVVGRTEGELRLDDPRMSRKHAEIEIRGASQMFVRDLASGNGTLLNGTRITTSALRPGDELQLGDSVLVLEPTPG